MKKQFIRKDFGLAVATLGLVLTVPAWATEPPAAANVSEELRAALRQHHEALKQHDLEALLALYADTPTVALMGTGPGEFWKGKAAVEDTYKRYFETFKAGSLSHECPEATGTEDGNSAWLMASCIMKDTTPDGEPREFGLNVSAVLKKEPAGWRFQALHFSNLAADDEPPLEEEGEAPEAETAPDKAE
jgi:ketosteroid isomerase-like protein